MQNRHPLKNIFLRAAFLFVFFFTEKMKKILNKSKIKLMNIDITYIHSNSLFFLNV